MRKKKTEVQRDRETKRDETEMDHRILAMPCFAVRHFCKNNKLILLRVKKNKAQEVDTEGRSGPAIFDRTRHTRCD